jgi:hypothetical protein
MASHNKSAGARVKASNGGLRIYREPEEGRRYVVGIDSSEGIRGGDYASACVLDLETCEDVAWYYGHYDPTDWGRMNCRLGFLYNTACLGFETAQSTHGSTAAQQAVSLKYPNLYLRRRMDTVSRQWTEKLGWETKEGTRRQALDRGRKALGDGTRINCPGLLQELREAQVVEGGTLRNKIAFKHHDDRAMSWCIGLCVRDDLYVAGTVPKEPEERVTDPSELHWREFERMYGGDVDPNESPRGRRQRRRVRRKAHRYVR